jgi:hypothetical protein
MANARKPFSPIRRSILVTLNDGEKHWPDELYRRLDYSRRNSVVAALNWFLRHKYVTVTEHMPVIIEPDQTDYVYTLTAKGKKAAENLDYGYDLLNP